MSRIIWTVSLASSMPQHSVHIVVIVHGEAHRVLSPAPACSDPHVPRRLAATVFLCPARPLPTHLMLSRYLVFIVCSSCMQLWLPCRAASRCLGRTGSRVARTQRQPPAPSGNDLRTHLILSLCRSTHQVATYTLGCLLQLRSSAFQFPIPCNILSEGQASGSGRWRMHSSLFRQARHSRTWATLC